MRLSYLLIKGTEKLSFDEIQTIVNLLAEMLPSSDIKQDGNFLIVFLNEPFEYDFKDFITNTNNEMYLDLSLYESGVFDSYDLLKKDVNHKKMELKFDTVYESEKTVFYERVMYYIDDTFKKHVLKDFFDNDEFLHSIKVFIEKNQNTSEAAKFLYMHRNTLINRIEKFHKITGYDVRKFEDALVVYLLVKNIK